MRGWCILSSDTITSITEFLENCNAPDILNPYSSSSNHPHLSVISSIHHNPILSEDKVHQPLITEAPTRITHCLFAVLGCMRQYLLHLLYLWEIKAYDYLLLLWYDKSHSRKVNGSWYILSSTNHLSDSCGIKFQTWTNSKIGTVLL